MREIILPGDELPKSLENYLKKQFPIGYVRKVLRKHGVRVNGQRAKAESFIQGGDRIQLYIPFEAPPSKGKAPVTDVKFSVLFEDASILVIDKPAGVAVHESKTDRKQESVIGILERRYREAGVKPMLVHRLDKDTSGVLIVAKDEPTAAELVRLFENGAVKKQYLALVVGRLPGNDGKIDFPLPGREGHPVRALTRYRVVKRYSETTLVRVEIDTGRLHQIRLHFAELGYPIVMDNQHGDFNFNKRFRKEFGLKRQFLHAQKLALLYAGKSRDWTAPLARDIDDTLQRLSDS